jgi:hypothetical protein
MASKKKSGASVGDLPAVRIGSRVRCTDDGVEGRIVWANAVSVKIKWDDAEEVTWRRDSLAGRPIEILEADAAEDQGIDRPGISGASEQVAPTERSQADPETAPPTPEQADVAEAPIGEPVPLPQEQDQPATADQPSAEPTPADESLQAAPAGRGGALEPVSATTPKRQRKAPSEPKEKKLSALDAAAKILAEEGRPMTCQELIDAMAARGYWVSPKGVTPAATLYSALLREITTKGDAARFVKTERGKFGLRSIA